jgi:hypothetical protein
MTKKTLAMILVALAAGVLVYWAASGGHVFTQTKVQEEVKDELFGTTSVVWKDQFRPGLDYAGPAAGGLLAIAGFLFWRSRREGRRLQVA